MGLRRSSPTGYEGVGFAGAATGRHRLADADSDQTKASPRRRNVLEIGKDLSYAINISIPQLCISFIFKTLSDAKIKRSSF